MPALPTGTVTFLFTDVEGSTPLWEHHAVQMQLATARHDELVEAHVHQHGGELVRPRGEGDSRFAVFTHATDAVAAASALQQALYAEQWLTPAPLRVRMALHTGQADLREGDYYGSAVNRCARLRAAGHGGQTLISRATWELVRDSVPPGVDLRDMGEHHLKDLNRPEHIYQVLIPGLPPEFPALRTLTMRPNNLPVQGTPFIGRERDVGAVRTLLGRPEVRLLTLIGPGGTGKTRLALQVAAELLDDFPDGVYRVGLAPVTDPQLVLSEIGGVLNVPETGGTALRESITEHLRDKQLLLLLDNMEQLIEAGPLVVELLAGCPGLKVLVTSRIVLRVSGEYEYPVPPMSLPDPARLPGLDALSEYEAVRLFIERARAVRPDFALTHEIATAIAEICLRLDGLPLAIELAAARIRLLPPQAMLSRLASRLKLLTGGARDLPARQQTLGNTIEWSYRLLGEEEQRLFWRLAVFSGGCSLEAAEEVCSGDGLDVLTGLELLVQHSLLRQDGELEPRFAMLQTIGEYAQEKLRVSGEEPDLRREHGEYYLRLAEAAQRELYGPQQAELLRQLDAEHSNLRAALAWSFAGGDAEVGARIAVALWRFWYIRGHLQEARTWLAQALAKGVAGDAALRGKVLNAAGAGASVQGDFESGRALFEERIALERERGDKDALAQAIHNLATTLLEEDPARARVLFDESLRLEEELGDKEGIAYNLGGLANAENHMGRVIEARGLWERSLALHQELSDTRSVALTVHNLSTGALALGELDEARTLSARSLRLFEELQDRPLMIEALLNLAEISCASGQHAQAARLLGGAEALRAAIGAVAATSPPDQDTNDAKVVSASRAALGDATFESEWSMGRAMLPEAALQHALLSVGHDTPAVPLRTSRG